MEHIYSLDEAAKALRIGRRTLDRMRAGGGYPPGRRLRGRVVMTESDLQQYLYPSRSHASMDELLAQWKDESS